MTETWAQENLYCPSCTSDYLDTAPTGKQIIDYMCPDCEEQYQLKSKSGPFGGSVANTAYWPKIRAIRTETNPSYLFLRYDPQEYMVLDLFLVPKHFMVPSVIQKRTRLSKSARRAGWIGSNILLRNLPLDARIPIVENGEEISKSKVRTEWKRFLFLREQSVYSRGWVADVLGAVRELDSETFALADVYAFEKKLAKLHPKNKHIRPKIRQQLQVLRDYGVIEFMGRGNYRIL